MSIKMRVAVLFVVSYFSGSKMGGSDNDIIFVSALGKIQVRRKCFQFGRDLEFNCMFRFWTKRNVFNLDLSDNNVLVKCFL